MQGGASVPAYLLEFGSDIRYYLDGLFRVVRWERDCAGWAGEQGGQCDHYAEVSFIPEGNLAPWGIGWNAHWMQAGNVSIESGRHHTLLVEEPPSSQRMLIASDDAWPVQMAGDFGYDGHRLLPSRGLEVIAYKSLGPLEPLPVVSFLRVGQHDGLGDWAWADQNARGSPWTHAEIVAAGRPTPRPTPEEHCVASYRIDPYDKRELHPVQPAFIRAEVTWPRSGGGSVEVEVRGTDGLLASRLQAAGQGAGKSDERCGDLLRNPPIISPEDALRSVERLGLRNFDAHKAIVMLVPWHQTFERPPSQGWFTWVVSWTPPEFNDTVGVVVMHHVEVDAHFGHPVHARIYPDQLGAI